MLAWIELRPEMPLGWIESVCKPSNLRKLQPLSDQILGHSEIVQRVLGGALVLSPESRREAV